MAEKLDVERLYKIYGPDPRAALRLVEGGSSPKDILARTGQVVAVSDISFTVGRGEIFTIMGLSGSGKSTLVRCINRLIEPSAGRLAIDGEDVRAKSRAEMRELRRRKVAMVFQNFALLPHKTVLENVELGLMLRGEPVKLRRRKAYGVLDQVGLADWGDRYPDNLSGGMKQRVGLARALANDPDILLMDEPFSALDPLIRSDLQVELMRLQSAIKKTIVFITHDFHEAVRLSDRLAVMRDGRFVQIGTPHDIVLRPVDDYVGTFARELDRTRLLRAGDLAREGVLVVEADASARSVHSRLSLSQGAYALVVDAARRPIGYLEREALAASGHLDLRAADAVRERSVPSIAASAPLSALYPLLRRRMPVSILDEQGTVLGAVDAVDVVAQLAAAPAADSTEPRRRSWAGQDSPNESSAA
jgi:glycine betaine/proline transport system ATP-binding protein